MPQVKGTATWLTNVRQDTPDGRVRLDYSSPHIENERIEQEKELELDDIYSKKHRALADRAHAIREAKDAVQKYTQMQLLMKNNAVETFLRLRREQFKKSVEEANTEETLRRQDKIFPKPRHPQLRPSTSTTQRRPKSTTPVRRPWTAHGVSPNHLSAGDTISADTLREAKLRMADPKWQTVALPVSNGSHRPRRPKTSYKPRSRLEIRQSLMVEFQAKNAQGKTRVRTSQGFAKGKDDEDDDSDVDLQQLLAERASQPSKQRVSLLSPSKVLSCKDLSSLREAEKAVVRTQMMEIRQKENAIEHIRLQHKVKDFYQNIKDLHLKTLSGRLDLMAAVSRRPISTYYK